MESSTPRNGMGVTPPPEADAPDLSHLRPLSDPTAQFWSQHLLAEQRELLQRQLDSYRFESEVLWRMMTLAGGTVGIVIPILAGQKVVAHPEWLWTAAGTFIVTIAIGVAIHAIGRWLMAVQAALTQETYTPLLEAVGGIGTRGELHAVEEMAKAAAAQEERVRHFRRRAVKLGLLFDGVFYGPLLYGFWCVARSIRG